MTRVQIAELTSERDVALLEKSNMQDQWELAINELSSTRVLLNDTLAALELLREYQSIDDETKKDIEEIDDTLDPEGNATEETYQAFRDMMEKFNRLQGNLVTNAGVTFKILDITPFVELKKDAEGLFRTVSDMLLEYKK